MKETKAQQEAAFSHPYEKFDRRAVAVIIQQNDFAAFLL